MRTDPKVAELTTPVTRLAGRLCEIMDEHEALMTRFDALCEEAEAVGALDWCLDEMEHDGDRMMPMCLLLMVRRRRFKDDCCTSLTVLGGNPWDWEGDEIPDIIAPIYDAWGDYKDRIERCIRDLRWRSGLEGPTLLDFIEKKPVGAEDSRLRILAASK